MHGIQARQGLWASWSTFPSLKRLWAATLYCQHLFLRFSSPSPSSGIRRPSAQFFGLVHFLEMKGTDKCHLSCPWRWDRRQGEQSLKVKKTLFTGFRIFLKDGLEPSFCALVGNLMVLWRWLIQCRVQSRASQPRHTCHFGQDDASLLGGGSLIYVRTTSGSYLLDASNTSHGCDN